MSRGGKEQAQGGVWAGSWALCGGRVSCESTGSVQSGDTLCHFESAFRQVEELLTALECDAKPSHWFDVCVTSVKSFKPPRASRPPPSWRRRDSISRALGTRCQGRPLSALSPGFCSGGTEAQRRTFLSYTRCAVLGAAFDK